MPQVQASWELSAGLIDQLTQARRQLRAELDSLRSMYRSQSEQWRESEPGADIGTWLGELANLADTLEDTPVR